MTSSLEAGEDGTRHILAPLLPHGVKPKVLPTLQSLGGPDEAPCCRMPSLSLRSCPGGLACLPVPSPASFLTPDGALCYNQSLARGALSQG